MVATQHDNGSMTADFLGLEAMVDGIKYKATQGGSRAVVTISFNAHSRRDLLAQLADSLNGPVFVGFGFPQLSLDGFIDPSPAAPKPTPQMITPDGEIILAHGFRPGKPDRFTCAICETPESNAIHSEESRKAVHTPPDAQDAP